MSVRLLVAVVGLAVAYHYSLGTLLGAWRYQTPLSELALVPPLAAALLVLAAIRHRHVGKIRLGRLDFVVAGFFLGLVVLPAVVGPVVYSNYVWPMRLDLLTLPLAAAATCVLLFGTRSLVAFVFPLAFLFLAWPLPHSIAVEHLLGTITSWTAAAVTAVVGIVPLAEPVPAADDARYTVTHGGSEFVLSVGSACSGINSLVGFLVVGVACIYLIQGPVRRRLLWLAVGLPVVWVFNILRILLIFVAGRWYGESAAIDVVHPIGGLLALNAAFIVLLLLIPPFGLALRSVSAPADSGTPLSKPAPPAERPTNRGIAVRVAVLAPVVLVLALANGQLAAAGRTFDNHGLPKVKPFAANPVAGWRWRAERVAKFPWARQYFGDDATWVRYRIDRSAAPSSRRFTVWADSIVTSDLGALRAFPVRECYDFHRYGVSLARRVEIGGVVGQLLAFSDGKGLLWHALTWEWPVRRGAGKVEHERMTLLASSVAHPLRPEPTRESASLRTAVLSALNLFEPDQDSNPVVSGALEEVAADMIARRITGTTSGVPQD